MKKQARRILGQLSGTPGELRKLWLRLWVPGIVATTLGFAVAWMFVKPSPPGRIVLAAGPKEGAYYQFAEQYETFLAKHGVELVVLETAGSVENYELLNSGEADWAIVQGGTLPDREIEHDLESLGSVYLEPIWIFHSRGVEVRQIRDLADLRLAVGRDGSGTQAAIGALLDANGIDWKTNENALRIGGREAADALTSGELDAACFVTSSSNDLIRELASHRELQIATLERRDAYTHVLPYLSGVTLHRGVLNLREDHPPRDVELLAPAALLICREDLHEAFVPLILSAARGIFSNDSTLNTDDEFPSRRYVELPLNDAADRYFTSGPPLLQRLVPFWIASLIDRGKVLLLPTIALLLPLLKVTPALYRWRVRSSIFEWYEVLRKIEQDLADEAIQNYQGHIETLAEMESELDEVKTIPTTYMQEFYNLRLHLEFVQRKLRRKSAH